MGLLHHHIPHHRRQEIVIIARCGFGKESVDKCLGITGFAHSGPAAPQYRKGVPIFPDQAHLDVGDRGQEIILDFGCQSAIPQNAQMTEDTLGEIPTALRYNDCSAIAKLDWWILLLFIKSTVFPDQFATLLTFQRNLMSGASNLSQ